MKKQTTILVLLGLILISCNSTPRTTRLVSDNFSSKASRVAALQKEIKSFSEFEDAEFDLFNVNGFSEQGTSLPGASSWNYKFVVRVAPTHVDKWTEGLIPAQPNNQHLWTQKIIQHRKDAWKTDSQPEYYIRKGHDVMVIVYRPEGIIFKSVVNL